MNSSPPWFITHMARILSFVFVKTTFVELKLNCYIRHSSNCFYSIQNTVFFDSIWILLSFDVRRLCSVTSSKSRREWIPRPHASTMFGMSLLVTYSFVLHPWTLTNRLRGSCWDISYGVFSPHISFFFKKKDLPFNLLS